LKNKKNGNIAGEVESQMEYLFEENDKTPVFSEDSGASDDSPIKSLKASILSIEWEISDELLNTLVGEIGKLEQTFKGDKDLLLFLQLLGSVAKYIKKRKVNAHPDAITLLNSVYNSLERVVLSKDILEDEKRETLLVQVGNFKKLKERIASRKVDEEKKPVTKLPRTPAPTISEKDAAAPVKPPPAGKIPEVSPPDIDGMTPQEMLAHVLAEVRSVIRAEFERLREDLNK
jgi:hypothetical protein